MACCMCFTIDHPLRYGDKGTWYFIGAWYSVAKDMPADKHGKHIPDQSEVDTFATAHGWAQAASSSAVAS